MTTVAENGITTDATAQDDRMALRAAIRDLLADRSDEARVRAAVTDQGGLDSALWAQVFGLGVIELAATEQRVTAGASYLDLVVLFSELGRALAPVPALTTAVAIAALGQWQSQHQAPELVAWAQDVIAGRRRATVSLAVDDELQPAPSVLVRQTPAGPRLSGAVRAVPNAVGADAVIVLAASEAGPGLYLVADSEASATPVEVLDLTRPAADLEFTDAEALPVIEAGSDPTALERLLLVWWLLQAAEQVGVAQRALDEAVSYAKLRHQFGRAIGSFQAIKHACTEMLVRVEGARGLVDAAARALDADDEPELHVSLAAAYANEAAVECAARALQIHGGIGYTWEHVSHLILRKATSGGVLVGSAAAHWQAVTRQLARRAPAASS